MRNSLLIGVFLLTPLFMGADYKPPNEKLPTIERAKRLYQDLLLFKEKDDFREYGFGKGGPYHTWDIAAKTLSDGLTREEKVDFLRKHDVSMGDIGQLGFEYVKSRGAETEFSRNTRARLDKAFK